MDLKPPRHLSDRIRAVLRDRGIIVYQCARLLDSEIADIRLYGLRAASTSLLSDKVKAAREEGLLTEDQAKRLLTTVRALEYCVIEEAEISECPPIAMQ